MKLSELKQLAEKAIADRTLHVTKEFVDNFPSTVLALLADREQLLEMLRVCIPIVEEAYWDHHTAGIMPGSGYSNRAQHLAGRQWNWQDSSNFKNWITKARAALKRSEELEK